MWTEFLASNGQQLEDIDEIDEDSEMPMWYNTWTDYPEPSDEDSDEEVEVEGPAVDLRISFLKEIASFFGTPKQPKALILLRYICFGLCFFKDHSVASAKDSTGDESMDSMHVGVPVSPSIVSKRKLAVRQQFDRSETYCQWIGCDPALRNLFYPKLLDSLYDRFNALENLVQAINSGDVTDPPPFLQYFGVVSDAELRVIIDIIFHLLVNCREDEGFVDAVKHTVIHSSPDSEHPIYSPISQLTLLNVLIEISCQLSTSHGAAVPVKKLFLVLWKVLLMVLPTPRDECINIGAKGNIQHKNPPWTKPIKGSSTARDVDIFKEDAVGRTLLLGSVGPSKIPIPVDESLRKLQSANKLPPALTDLLKRQKDYQNQRDELFDFTAQLSPEEKALLDPFDNLEIDIDLLPTDGIVQDPKISTKEFEIMIRRNDFSEDTDEDTGAGKFMAMGRRSHLNFGAVRGGKVHGTEPPRKRSATEMMFDEQLGTYYRTRRELTDIQQFLGIPRALLLESEKTESEKLFQSLQPRMKTFILSCLVAVIKTLNSKFKTTADHDIFLHGGALQPRDPPPVKGRKVANNRYPVFTGGQSFLDNPHTDYESTLGRYFQRLGNVVLETSVATKDLTRHSEIISKSASAILITLMVAFRDSHLLQFHSFCSTFSKNRGIDILMTILSNVDIVKLSSTDSDLHGCGHLGIPTSESPKAKPAPVPSAVKKKKRRFTTRRASSNLMNTLQTAQTKQADSPDAPPFENERILFLLINIGHILHKLTHHNPLRTKYVLQEHKGHLNLQKPFKIRHHLVCRYFLEVFKECMPFISPSWRDNNSRVVSLIYLHCPLDFNDRWLYKEGGFDDHALDQLEDDYDLAVDTFIKRHYTDWKSHIPSFDTNLVKKRLVTCGLVPQDPFEKFADNPKQLFSEITTNPTHLSSALSPLCNWWMDVHSLLLMEKSSTNLPSFTSLENSTINSKLPTIQKPHLANYLKDVLPHLYDEKFLDQRLLEILET